MMKNISRNDVIELITKYRLAFIARDKLIDELEGNFENIESGIFDMVYHELSGCSNGFLSDFYLTLTGDKVEVIGEIQQLLVCPCCGFRTLSEIYDACKGTGYDICKYCEWEDDGTVEASKSSSVNRGSISEYRNRILENKNFFYKNKWLKYSAKCLC